MEEQWRDVPGYEGIYEVSSFGKVRTKEGKITESNHHGLRLWKSRILKQKNSKGYKKVSLYKNKRRRDLYVHRLVAMAFLRKPRGKDLVNHIDGRTTNNRADNLEWCNHKENLIHAYETGLNKCPVKVALSDRRSGKILEFYSMGEASRFLGRNPGYVSACLLRGKTEVDGYIIIKQEDQKNVRKKV